ncbi:MAG: dipeptidase [Stappiaceae bacterium]
MKNPPIFDGHNDVLTRLYENGGLSQVPGFITGQEGHINLPKAKAGGLAGGFFAVWIPPIEDLGNIIDQMETPPYDLPLPAMIPQADALQVAMAQIAILNRLETHGAVQICTYVDGIEHCMEHGEKLAAILHMEGAEAIDRDFHVLDVLWRAGLRSLGPVWSRNTIYAEGVPFRFPSGPDIGGGLTEDGKRLIKKCNELGILVDLSHLNEAGFWDVARLSDAPLVATHSNAHALCPHARNLTDKQLGAIAESDGMVGLNFAAAFLRDDGRMNPDIPMARVLEQLDYLVEHLGEDRVGLGSDFDGATVPDVISDASGLPALRSAMIEHGYTETLIEKICYRNWMRVLRKTWK